MVRFSNHVRKGHNAIQSRFSGRQHGDEPRAEASARVLRQAQDDTLFLVRRIIVIS